MVNGVEGKLQAVGNAELVEDIVQVIFYRLFADEKLFADFLVAEALRDELHDFLFAVAQQGLFAARAGFRGFGESLHDFGGHAVVQPDFAGVHAVNAFYQQVGGGLLENYAARAEAHGAHHVAIVFGGGEHHHARGQRIEVHFFQHRQPVFVGHAQIKQENIGLELGEHLDAFRAVLRFADNSDVFVGIQELAETVAKNRMVIGKEHTNLLFSFGHVNRVESRQLDALHGQG